MTTNPKIKKVTRYEFDGNTFKTKEDAITRKNIKRFRERFHPSSANDANKMIKSAEQVIKFLQAHLKEIEGAKLETKTIDDKSI
jgi:HEPN domain-containing protein